MGINEVAICAIEDWFCLHIKSLFVSLDEVFLCFISAAWEGNIKVPVYYTNWLIDIY